MKTKIYLLTLALSAVANGFSQESLDIPSPAGCMSRQRRRLQWRSPERLLRSTMSSLSSSMSLARISTASMSPVS